mgnify:CR=1 FL=1
MCGVVGIVSQKEVSPVIYDALTILQHRGQDAAGVATSTNNRFFIRKQLGLVRDVIRNQHILNLRGQMGIGHVRYPTAGHADSSAEAQPFYVNSPYGIGLAHNGNLINSTDLKKNLFLAICIGYLQIIAATNLAFFIMREIEIAFIFFGFIIFLFMIGFFCFCRRHLPGS